jgi:hypothetical protein
VNGGSRQTAANMCIGNARYPADQPALCAEQLTVRACNQVRDDSFELGDIAPACGRICEVE